MGESADRVEIGRLNGAWGAAGWVKIYSLTQPPENIFEYQPWRTSVSPGFLHVRQWRRQGPRLVAQVEEIDTRDRAEELQGAALFIERSDLPRAGEDSWYWHDLIGLAVFNREGQHLGQVKGLLDAGVHDVLEIRRGAAQPDLLVPFVPGHFVDEVDTAARRITVDWQPDWTDAD
ncbi:MAG: 16S rRNA processing protein RimM [Wenzhouxiangellaceae bacterium]|nr:16S rRNA processing protein RimM [Wenzhouxiangellaceae bacterium]MBS3747221.1 16S rRNA processing protein RimM [Wenzhouxiangellaceae bacterium]MBS3823229.1 16S rRNA processing protein RimM [Wenzhouxiangellaceae bacterium]